MRLFLFAVLLVSSMLSLTSCGSSNQLGTIGQETLTLREFEETFARNNGGWEKAAQSSLPQRENFLKLLVNYKLKLQEAHARGLLRDSTIQAELSAYRSSAASSYMIEKELIEPTLKVLFERRKEIIRASHILLRVASDAAPADTLRVYQRALELCSRARTEPFDSLARTFSEDPTALTNGGDLGWFTQGRMVRPFEDAAFALQAGEVSSKPIRTQFGYHIVKAVRREPNGGSLQVAHILKRFSEDLSDTAAVRDTMNALYEKLLKRNLTFEQGVEQYSDDPASKARLGFTGVYDRTQVPPEMSDLLFATPVGSFTAPVRAPYGYHIFYIMGTVPPQEDEKLEAEVRDYYRQMYYMSDYQEFLYRLKKQYNLSFDVKLRYALTQSLDSTKTPASPDWTNGVKSDWRSKPLFTYEKKNFTVQNFLDHVESSQEFSQTRLTPSNVDEIVDRVVDSELLAYHTSTLTDRYPDFADLMKEYENGVLIYRIDQDEVWQKLEVNDSLLYAFYETTKRQYRQDYTVKIAEVHVSSDSMGTAIYQRVRAGEDFAALAASYTTRPGFKEKKGEWDFLPVDANDLTAMAGSMAVDSVAPPVRFQGGWSVVKLMALKPPHIMSFEEARPTVITNYRTHASKLREEQWIEELKMRFGVRLNPDLLIHAFKNRPSS